jgi:predicted O-linked N-acetylglucosamine transferase (SPINDLY family)
MADPTIQQTFDLAVEHHQAGRLLQAQQLYQHILVQEPQNIVVMHNLGMLAQQMGRNDLALDLMHRVIAVDPNLAEAHDGLGIALRGSGQLDEAIAAHRRAIVLRPEFPEAHNNLGSALWEKGQLDDAIAALCQAIALNPNFAKAYNNLAVALRDKGLLGEAIALARQAIALDPSLPEAHNNLGNFLRDEGQLDEAIAADRHAVALRPEYAKAYNNLGMALKDQGQLDDAVAAFGRAMALRCDDPESHSNLILTMHYDDGYDAGAMTEELRRWNHRHAEPLRRFLRPHSNDLNPGRRLRIGYVSPDFRGHPVGGFLLPLLTHHDKTQVEVFAYAQLSAPDAVTQQLRSCTDEWRSVLGLSDSQLAELIHQDQIDILVDLAMHAAGNRLLVFARKPAPVQVSYLAYCGTTGLETMDYRLSDPYLDPTGMHESIYSEQTIRLPRTYWCYQSMISPSEPSPLPALTRGIVTFGCLNNFCKIRERALSTWAKILRNVPNSQLLLSAAEGTHRQRVQERLESDGIERTRVRFSARCPFREYFGLYNGIDVALDTFPFCGGMTTCDALWMGVPTVTLAGKTAVGRGGLSILSNVGLSELVGDCEDDYVRLGVELATDLPRLQELRRGLRGRMERSPLMDAPRFARDIEAAYRRMWHKWCATG